MKTGRPRTKWQSRTTAIRIPEQFAEALTDIARQMEAGEWPRLERPGVFRYLLNADGRHEWRRIEFDAFGPSRNAGGMRSHVGRLGAGEMCITPDECAALRLAYPDQYKEEIF